MNSVTNSRASTGELTKSQEQLDSSIKDLDSESDHEILDELRKIINSEFSPEIEELRDQLHMVQKPLKVGLRELSKHSFVEGELSDDRKELQAKIETKPIDPTDFYSSQLALAILIEEGKVDDVRRFVKHDILMMLTQLDELKVIVRDWPFSKPLKSERTRVLKTLTIIRRESERTGKIGFVELEKYNSNKNEIPLRNLIQLFYEKLNQIQLVTNQISLTFSAEAGKQSELAREKLAENYAQMLEAKLIRMSRKVDEVNGPQKSALDTLSNLRDLGVLMDRDPKTISKSLKELERAGLLPERPKAARSRPGHKNSGKQRSYDRKFFEVAIPLLQKKHPKANWAWYLPSDSQNQAE